MIYAIILAGGSGTRFWPLSRERKPKQFLNLYSKQPLLAESIERFHSLFDKENIYIATNKIYRDQTAKCLKNFHLPGANFLFEPEGKNTLAPISVLTSMLFDKDREAIVAVFPSDHFIKNKHKFLDTLKTGIELAKNGSIVTLGIVPQRPETGYGYIKVMPDEQRNKSGGYRAKRFIEKPDLKTAKKLVKDKRYFWNGGIFIFKAQTLLREIARFQPKTYQILKKIKNKKDLNKFWSGFPAISIDYAIMEKTKKLKLLPLDCGWSDLGSWPAVEEIRRKDKDGNLFKCDKGNIDLGSKNTLAWSGCRLVATLGLSNIIIVDTKDALLVCKKDRAQDVKRLVEILKKKKEECV